MRQTDPQCISFPKAASDLETNCMIQSMSLVLLQVGSMAVGSMAVGTPQGGCLKVYFSVCAIMLKIMLR